jgi:hypothetical protein
MSTNTNTNTSAIEVIRERNYWSASIEIGNRYECQLNLTAFPDEPAPAKSTSDAPCPAPLCDRCRGFLPAAGAIDWGCLCGVSDAEFDAVYRFWCD